MHAWNIHITSLIARLMGPTWGPSGADRTQVGPMLAPWTLLSGITAINTLRLSKNGRHFADHIFKCIFLNENVWISIEISLTFVSKGPINNIPGLVQIMAWRRPGDKPLSEPMMARLLRYICITRPQWAKQMMLSRCQELSNPLVSLILMGSSSHSNDT